MISLANNKLDNIFLILEWYLGPGRLYNKISSFIFKVSILLILG